MSGAKIGLFDLSLFGYGFGTNETPTSRSASTLTVHVGAIPPQAPPQLWNTWFAEPVAVRVTDVPDANDALTLLQVLVGDMPVGFEVTDQSPVPVAFTATCSECVPAAPLAFAQVDPFVPPEPVEPPSPAAETKIAVTCLSPSMVTTQSP